MYQIETRASFDAAHFLKGYPGKCKNLHGHRWSVVVTLEGGTLQSAGPERGMLADFGRIKADLTAMTEELDHALLVEKGSLRETTLAALREEGFRVAELPFPTTAERLSQYFYERLAEKGYALAAVKVYETPNNAAVYTGRGDNIVLL